MHKYHHSNDTQVTLVAELQEVGRRILAINFQDSTKDQETIRHHAYLRGKFDAINDILTDDYPSLQPTTES